MKYDSVDCKITEVENALSVLADKRQTQEQWVDDVRGRKDLGCEDNLSFSSETQRHESHL